MLFIKEKSLILSGCLQNVLHRKYHVMIFDG